VGQEKNRDKRSTDHYELIDTASKLLRFAQVADKADMVAVDLEADSMFHYQEKVCLLQMAANGKCVVIDPLKVKDLSPLKPVFANSRIRKVFHGADYDVRSLYRDFDITINNLFDTQLASMYLGYTETSLEAVVASRFGVELDKKYQKKDWSQRPLPPEMVAYAASDVLYLIPLAQKLIDELKARDRLDWVQEGCCLLSQVRPPENHLPMYLKFRGAGRLTPRQLAILEELLKLRDAIAQQKDRPLFKVINNKALLKIATDPPASFKQLANSQILSQKQLDMYGAGLMAAVKQGKQVPENQLPRYPRKRAPRLSPRIPKRVKALRSWRDETAARLKLDPALLLNKALIREIAIAKPKTREDLSQVAHIHKWQVDSFGDHIISILDRMP